MNRSVPEEIMPSLFSSVGMIIVSWTFVENCLDAWSAIAYHDHGGSVIERKLPRQFGQKANFLKKCFERLSSLSPLAAEAVSFIEKAEELSGIRHYIAHGVLTHFDPSDAPFKFIKMDMTQDKKQHVLGELHILGVDLVTAGVDLTNMAKEGHIVTGRLLNARLS